MEIVLNYSTVNNTSDHPVGQPSISSGSLEENCFQASVTSNSTEDTSNQDYLNELIREKFNDATVIVSVIVLVLINFIVIAGNILVILSVFTSAKLRTVTNFFIVSLAVADFLVGIAVLPYSLTLEILKTWLFGEIWCQGWLTIDVWMCTASILNLCAISVDRYLAVTQPVRYRSLMTAKRAKYMIAAVWVLSFIICFPLLIVRTKETSLGSRTNANRGQPSSPATYQMPLLWLEPSPLTSGTLHAPPGTTLHQSTNGENLSSSLASNFSSVSPSDLPFLPRPSAPSTQSPLASSPSPRANSSKPCIPQPVQCALFLNKSYVIYSAFGSFYIPMFVMIFFYWRIYLVAIRTTRALKRGYRTTKTSGDGTSEERLTLRIHRGCATEDNLGDKCVTSVISEMPTKKKQKSRAETAIKARIPITIIKARSSNKSNLTVSKVSRAGSAARGTKPNTLSPGDIVEVNGKNRRNSPGCQSTLSLPTSSPSSSREGSAKSNKVVMARLSKRTSKYQAKRFHAETKAAKTVGIIISGFIVCWFPFFTVYLIRAFCEDCISELLFSIFFWLGYCNSMINPMIYGLFSRDFRRAFKNIICKCKFSEETSVSSLIRQIHMPTFFEDMPEEMAKNESQDY